MNIDIGGQKHRRDMKNKWKILDISDGAEIKHDLNSSKPIPVKDNSVDSIFCSHTLEHIEPERITPLLRDFYRILKPGGVCRIVVPDASVAIYLYMNDAKKLEDKKYCSKPKETPNTPMARLSAWFYTKNKGQRTGHRMGFDEETLIAFLLSGGFKKIDKMSYNKCSKIFTGKDYDRYAGWSLFVEVTK